MRITWGMGVLLALGAIFCHTLLAPFDQPQVHVCVLSGDVPPDVWPEELPSLRPAPSACMLHPLMRSWTELARLPDPQSIAGLASGRTLEELFRFAESTQIRPGDVALGVVQSQLATINGELYLVDRLNPRDPQQGRVPFDKFVEAFRASTAGTKVICLDAGQLTADPRSEMSMNDFGERLRQVIEGTGDSRMWVLISHRAGQQSQSASGRMPTVFLDAMARGLRCSANQNGDQQISLGELVRFIQRETAAWEQGMGRALPLQTPWLLWGGGVWTEQAMEVVVAPVPPPPAAAPRTIAPAAGVALNSGTSETSAGETKEVAAAVAVRPVVSMTVPELLNAAWELRDQLEQAAPDTLRLRHCDFAPCQWNRLLSELVQAERLWRSQPEDFPARIHVLLQLRVNDLRALAGADHSSGSAWLKDVQTLQPRPVGEFNAAVSLALIEQWHRWTHGPICESDLAERKILRELLAAVDQKAFSQWIESKPVNLHAELQFACLLSSSSGHESPQFQQALRVRTKAEQLACHPVAIRWFAKDLLRGDQLRWYGERKLTDPARAADSVTAQQSLREAGAVYHQLEAATERVLAAERLESDLLADLPHWMALSRNHTLSIRSSLSAELKSLISDLGELIELLVNARSEECGRLEQLRSGLQGRRNRIEAALLPDAMFAEFGPAGTSAGELRPLAGALLETPLPTASQRRILQKWLTDFTVPSTVFLEAVPKSDDSPVVDLEPDYDLEERFARLLQPLKWQPDGEGDQPGRWKFPPINAEVPSGAERASRPREAASCCQAYIKLPGDLRTHLGTPSATGKPSMWAWRHTMRLVDPRDEIPLNVEMHLADLLLDEMRRVVHWHRQQATTALSDATSQEQARLQKQLDTLGVLSNNSVGDLRPAVSMDVVRVIMPDELNLATSPEQTLLLAVRNLQSVNTRVRYIVEYDPDLLEVETVSEHCQLISEASRTDSHIWPYDATPPMSPTRELPVAGQDDLRLRVCGQESESSTRLVVHIVTDRSSERQDIVVHLPQRPLARVQVQASCNEKLTVADQQLRPFGNRATSYSLSVQGLRRDDGTLDITAYRVTAPAISWPTATTVPTVDLQRWLSQTSEIQEIARLPGVSVKNDSAAPLRFPAVKPDANVSLDMAGGILIVMHDSTRQLSTWQHLPCAALRPAAYLDAQVNYDSSREMLKVAVRPRDELKLPAEGIPVRCRVIKHANEGRSEPLRLESAPTHSTTGMLQSHQREFMLNIPWRNSTDDAVVLIDVDDWPRAFVFVVEPDGVRPLEEFAAEILDPKQPSAVRAPAAMIPVTVAVTFPSRWVAAEALIEVGIDRNGDRRLDGEPTLRLPADRQTGVVLDSIDATGAWTLRTSVRDWQISVPTKGLSDQWGTVLARLACGPREVWSEGMPVVFDQDGPSLPRIQVANEGELTAGQPVRITAHADDRGLSGVARVSAGIDLSGLGIIGRDTILIAAKADGNDDWSVTLPTEELSPGPYLVVLQATDHAGNTGPVGVVPIRCLTAEEAAARAAVSVQGKVQYGGTAVVDAEVRMVSVAPPHAASGTITHKALTAKTNRWGQFAFDSVAPGQYDLIATGTVRGFRYESRSTVTVARGKEAAPIQLVFGQKAR